MLVVAPLSPIPKREKRSDKSEAMEKEAKPRLMVGKTRGCCQNAKLRHFSALCVQMVSLTSGVSPLLARALVRPALWLLSHRKEAAVVYQHQGVTSISKQPFCVLIWFATPKPSLGQPQDEKHKKTCSKEKLRPCWAVSAKCSTKVRSYPNSGLTTHGNLNEHACPCEPTETK